MKLKDVVALIFLAVILVIVGSVLINYFGKGKKTRTATIEVVRPIDPTFNSQAKVILLGNDKKYPVETFSAPVNLNQGLGNTSPFSGGQ